MILHRFVYSEMCISIVVPHPMSGLIHFMAGWCKRQPESGFSFVRFSFEAVCSFQ